MGDCELPAYPTEGRLSFQIHGPEFEQKWLEERVSQDLPSMVLVRLDGMGANHEVGFFVDSGNQVLINE